MQPHPNTTTEALTAAVRMSGRTGVDIARSIGKGDRYVLNTISARKDSQTSTLIAILRECGFRVTATNDRGDTIDLTGIMPN